MEKRKAHYALDVVKAIVIRDGMLSFTRIVSSATVFDVPMFTQIDGA